MPNVQADLDAIRAQHPEIQIDQDNVDKLARLAVDPHSQETYAGYLAEIAAKQARRAAPTSNRPFDSQGPMYDQATNQLSAAGRSALQARPQTLGQLIGLAGGDPRFSPSVPVAQRGMRAPMPGQAGPPTLGSLLYPQRHVATPDWSYLTRR